VFHDLKFNELPHKFADFYPAGIHVVRASCHIYNVWLLFVWLWMFLPGKLSLINLSLNWFSAKPLSKRIKHANGLKWTLRRLFRSFNLYLEIFAFLNLHQVFIKSGRRECPRRPRGWLRLYLHHQLTAVDVRSSVHLG
jgi:hypothetical protein